MKRENSQTVFQASEISVSRGGKKILDQISVKIESGTPYAIIGESGSGKTTFLLCAAGLLAPDTGTIEVGGHRLASLTPRERAARVGMVFQDYQLFPHLTVRENIELSPKIGKTPDFERRGLELLDALRISDLHERYPHQLSGGQKQRVAIARSLILEPSVLFLDEPSAALDERTTSDLATLLKSLNDRVQIVVVSHDRFFVENCCTRGIRINQGHTDGEHPVDELFKL